MNYTKTVWKDLPDTSTPITADKLNNLENGVDYLFENGTGGGDNLPVGVEMDFDGSSQDIPTGWESVTNPDSYSTSEVKTNMTWVDSKPIYRKVYSGQMVNATGSTSAIIFSIQNLSFDNIWLEEGKSFLTNSSETLPMNYYLTANDFLRTWVNKSNGEVKARSGVDLSGYTYNIVLEYTKTTD